MEYENYNIPEMTDDELMHWGVRGMRWGVRRYQNKDGTLTNAGKKRYNAELAKVREAEKVVKNRTAVKNRLDKLSARKKAVEDASKALDGEKKKFTLFKKKPTDAEQQPKKKKLSEMTDEELDTAIRRLKMEREYKSLATPETVSKGDGFVKKFLKNSVEPAAIEAGKSLIKDKLLDLGKKKLGLSEKQLELSEKQVQNGMDELNKELKQIQIEKARFELESQKKASMNSPAQTQTTHTPTQTAPKPANPNPTRQPAGAVVTKTAQNYVNNSSATKQPIRNVVNKKSTTSSGKNYVKKSGLENSDWQDFKRKYPWGVEPYATDRG